MKRPPNFSVPKVLRLVSLVQGSVIDHSLQIMSSSVQILNRSIAFLFHTFSYFLILSHIFNLKCSGFKLVPLISYTFLFHPLFSFFFHYAIIPIPFSFSLSFGLMPSSSSHMGRTHGRSQFDLNILRPLGVCTTTVSPHIHMNRKGTYQLWVTWRNKMIGDHSGKSRDI